MTNVNTTKSYSEWLEDDPFSARIKKKAAKPKVIQLRAGNTVGGRRRISFCSCVSRSLGAAVTPLHRIFPPTSPGN